MTVIGVTGKSGSGKSTYCREQAAKSGGVHIDVDEVCHTVIERHREYVCRELGLPVTLTRRELGETFFRDRRKNFLLVQKLWPEIEAAVLGKIAHCRATGVDALVDFILLPKSKALLDECDVLVRVDAPLEVRKERVLKRDGISEEYFLLREAASMDYDRIEFDHVEAT